MRDEATYCMQKITNSRCTPLYEAFSFKRITSSLVRSEAALSALCTGVAKAESCSNCLRYNQNHEHGSVER